MKKNSIAFHVSGRIFEKSRQVNNPATLLTVTTFMGL
jgi:hypothetical protein